MATSKLCEESLYVTVRRIARRRGLPMKLADELLSAMHSLRCFDRSSLRVQLAVLDLQSSSKLGSNAGEKADRKAGELGDNRFAQASLEAKADHKAVAATPVNPAVPRGEAPKAATPQQDSAKKADRKSVV